MKIYQSLVNIMSEIGAIAKSGWNEKQKYHFRKAEDVAAALQPLLVKHSVVIVPKVLEEHYTEKPSNSGSIMIYRTLKVEYSFTHAEDQSQVIAVVVGEGADAGDKASNKALTAAFKYAVCQVLCISDDEDSEKHSPELAASLYEPSKAFDYYNFSSKAKKLGILSESKIKELSDAYAGKPSSGIDSYLAGAKNA